MNTRQLIQGIQSTLQASRLPPRVQQDPTSSILSQLLSRITFVRGEKGDKGDPGIMGFRGAKGEKGDTIVGPPGPKGDRGLAGEDAKPITIHRGATPPKNPSPGDLWVTD